MVNETIVNRLLNNIEGYTQELRLASDITYTRSWHKLRMLCFNNPKSKI